MDEAEAEAKLKLRLHYRQILSQHCVQVVFHVRTNSCYLRTFDNDSTSTNVTTKHGRDDRVLVVIGIRHKF